VEGRVEGEIPIGPTLFAAKHESMYETLEVLALLDAPAVVVKRELANIPGWGWVARQHGVIPVDREGSASALRTMVRAGRKAAADGRSVVIFPEGTRVEPGEEPPLRAGFAGLYRGLGLPVVPVAIDSGRLYPRRGLLKRPGVIRFRFGTPIPPGLPRDQAEAAVHAGINALHR
jgi:1-acyl-sn-glycerol-3-phosphate acyltransferase